MLNRRSSSPPPMEEEPRPNSLLQVSLVVLFLGYWVFVVVLERPDVSGANWMGVVPELLRGIVTPVANALHPRVLRHFIPLFVGWYLASQAAVGTVRVLYGLRDQDVARQFLAALQTGAPMNSKILGLRAQTLAKDRSKWVAVGIGGPSKLGVTHNEVAVTEINGRFEGFIRPGQGRILKRMEYVRAILDLRVHERAQEDVVVITRDGLEVKLDVTVVFCIDTGGEERSETVPYPFLEEAAQAAAYTQTVMADDTVRTWDSLPILMAQGQLRHIVAQYYLDELLPVMNEVDDPHAAVQKELIRKVQAKVKHNGIEICDIRLGRFEFEQPIVEQYIRYWQTHLQDEIEAYQVEGEAEKLEVVEIARAEAELTMMQAILEGVNKGQAVGQNSVMREIVALRLIEALEKMAKQSQQSQPLPPELTSELATLRQAIAPPMPVVPKLLTTEQPVEEMWEKGGNEGYDE